MTGYKENYVSIRHIYYLLYRKCDFATNKISALSKGIQELIDNTDLDIQIPKYKNEYLYSTSKLRANTKNGYFISVDTDDIQRIYKIPFRMKDNVLRYYLFVLSTFLIKKEVYLSETDKKSNCIGCMYQKVIREKLNISQSAQFTYNDILQNDLHLLYITEYNITYHKKDGTFGSAPSIYGRYEDRDYIEAYVQQKYPQAVEENKKSVMNRHRSMIMKYNEICRGGKYDRNAIQEVFEYIKQYNTQLNQKIEEFERQGNKSQADNERKKIKDLTVFEKLK